MAWFSSRNTNNTGDNGGGHAVNRSCDCEALERKNDWSSICQCRDNFTSSKSSDKICSRCIMGMHSWNRK